MVESHLPSSDGEQGFSQSTRIALKDIRTWRDGGRCHKQVSSEVLLVLPFECLTWTKRLCPPRTRKGRRRHGERATNPTKTYLEASKMLNSPKAWPSGGRAALAAQSGLRRGQIQALGILKKDLQPKAGPTGELPSGTACRMNIIA